MSKQYTKEQFLETTEPYDYLLSIKNDPEQHERELAAITENASAVGIRNFGTLYKLYEKEKRTMTLRDMQKDILTRLYEEGLNAADSVETSEDAHKILLETANAFAFALEKTEEEK